MTDDAMTNDIVSELADLRRDVSALRGLIDSARASAPRQAEGSDATGAVWATIGADGPPPAIWIQDDWAQRLPGQRFGAAVVEAFARPASGQQSTRMGTVATTVDGLRFNRLQAGVFQLVVGPYGELIEQIHGHRLEAVSRMKDIADTLRQVANTYDAEEISGAHRLRNLR